MPEFRVLIADDSPTVLGMLSYAFSSSGYSVETAGDGFDAVQCVLRQPPDLVLLDVRMPKLNGTQACMLLKSDPTTHGVPVVLLTSQESGLERFYALRAGAEGILLKDCAPDAILRAAGECLSGKTPRGTAEEGKARSVPDNMEILSRANILLESMLFKTVLYNEISRIGREVEDFESTIRAMDKMLLEMVHHDAMAAVFSDGIFLESVIVYPFAADDLLRKATVNWTERLRENTGVPFAPNKSKVTEFLLDGKRPKEGLRPELCRPWVVCPVRSRETPKGLIALFSDGGSPGMTEGYPDEALLLHCFTMMENAWLYQQISGLSRTDGLTGLHNHRHFLESLKKEHARSTRYRVPFSLLMIDIDHFKKVNDVYGHPVGDTVLRELSVLLGEVARTTDSAARYGGEEFVLLLPETGKQGALIVAERLRQAVDRKLFASPSPLLHATVSIGVATFDPENPVPESKLLKHADEALYDAKRLGRNRVSER